MAEVFQRVDADDQVDPASNSSQPYNRTSTWRCIGILAGFASACSRCEGLKIKPMSVRCRRFDRPLRTAAPAATEIEQRHTRLEVRLAQGQIELRV